MSVVLMYDVTLKTAVLLLLGVFLMLAALVDYESMFIPDRSILCAVALFVLYALLDREPLAVLKTGLISGFGVSAALLLLVFIMDRLLGRESMGGGDIKLLFAIGLFLTWQKTALLLFAACIIGLLFALMDKGKQEIEGDEEVSAGAAEFGDEAHHRSKPFPFGPALVIAYWIVILFGDIMINKYLQLFI